MNYYVGSSANQSFDSRGYTVLTFIQPTLDGVNQPSLNDRTDRGDDVNARLLLVDNTGAAVVVFQLLLLLMEHQFQQLVRLILQELLMSISQFHQMHRLDSITWMLSLQAQQEVLV